MPAIIIQTMQAKQFTNIIFMGQFQYFFQKMKFN